jgi:cytochrome c-type biogenesis protein CcmF
VTQIGEVALWVALAISVWGIGSAFVGGYSRRGDLVLSAERTVLGVFGLLLVASLAIIAAFLGNEYRYQYVAGYSNIQLSTFYKISGLWAGQTGSLVFWALLLSGRSCSRSSPASPSSRTGRATGSSCPTWRERS